VTGIGLVALHRFVLVRLARWFQEAAVPFMLRRYEGRLRWALDHRLVVLAIAAAMFVGSIVLFAMFNRGYDIDQIVVMVKSPPRVIRALYEEWCTNLEAGRLRRMLGDG
jgi:hypothetical protein